MPDGVNLQKNSVFFLREVSRAPVLILSEITFGVGREVVHCGFEHDLIISTNTETKLERTQVWWFVCSMYCEFLHVKMWLNRFCKVAK